MESDHSQNDSLSAIESSSYYTAFCLSFADNNATLRLN